MEATEGETLKEGELYVVQKGELKRVERENDLPKIPMTEAAREALLDLRRRCRRVLGGFRPDIAMVSSALIEYAAMRTEAEAVVANYFAATMTASSTTGDTPSLDAQQVGTACADAATAKLWP